MQLEEQRKQIDEIDRVMLDAFSKRMTIVGDIARIKLREGRAICDENREKQVLAKISGEVQGELAPFAEQFFTMLMGISKEYQRQIITQEKGE